MNPNRLPTVAMMTVALAVGVLPLPSSEMPKPRRLFTHADEERLLKAQAKRDRQAAKRAQAQKGQQ